MIETGTITALARVLFEHDGLAFHFFEQFAIFDATLCYEFTPVGGRIGDFVWKDLIPDSSVRQLLMLAACNVLVALSLAGFGVTVYDVIRGRYGLTLTYARAGHNPPRVVRCEDGSRYALTPGDDSEGELYGMVGQELARVELARRMIVRSSNLATNILIEEVGAEAVRRTLAGLRAADVRVLRGVEDGPAYERGLNNTTTAAGLARVLASIARCESGDVPPALAPLRPEDCRRMTDLLAAQEFTDRIPAGLPRGVRVANKTGWITAIDHDAAIVYPPGRAPYVLVVLTRGFADRAVSGGGARVELFGAPARLPLGPAVLALESGAPAWAVAVRRTGLGTYATRVEPLAVPAGGSRRERLAAFLDAQARTFERLIADAPEQWWTLFFPIWTAGGFAPSGRRQADRGGES